MMQAKNYGDGIKSHLMKIIVGNFDTRKLDYGAW